VLAKAAGAGRSWHGEDKIQMKRRYTSLNGAITLSVIAFLTFLGRAFMDWRYEYPHQDPLGSWDTPGALIYMALAGLWLWGMLTAVRGSRRGLIGSLIAVLVLDVAFALATYFFFCPPWTGCQGWPNAWPWNWANLITGAVAAVALVLQVRQQTAVGQRPVATPTAGPRRARARAPKRSRR